MLRHSQKEKILQSVPVDPSAGG
ncbi:hypothetical protein MAR_000112 [Mya arenaria]|uniref:Uncharacterized protein n=1 Tax=Mya arenaria TaxID=6604 RepID=A0ABY7FBV1_MYAAR|nr:hypothetical protein MAR_000112 [Mya arenaria]